MAKGVVRNQGQIHHDSDEEAHDPVGLHRSRYKALGDYYITSGLRLKNRM